MIADESTLPPIQKTLPDVFILESLDEDDEEQQRFEGAVLADVLRFCGKQPIYRYFRTKKELRRFSDEFRASQYRFLHLSCHGDTEGFQFRFDDITFGAFAEIFKRKLRNRRLFLSSCQGGNQEFVEQVSSSSPGMLCARRLDDGSARRLDDGHRAVAARGLA